MVNIETIEAKSEQEVENFFAEVLFEMLEAQIEKETGIKNAPVEIINVTDKLKTA